MKIKPITEGLTYPGFIVAAVEYSVKICNLLIVSLRILCALTRSDGIPEIMADFFLECICLGNMQITYIGNV